MAGDFGHYTILAEIGRGGMGIVYQALDERDGQVVAIKQLVFNNIDPSKQGEFRDRFRREAATAARLKHPNIVTVHDISMDEPETYFYVMEYLEGNSLRRELELKGGRLTPREFWPIFDQVVEGLSFAHSMNVVHRDVKPDNIFILKDGQVKITDFGIARTTEYEQTHLTKTGVMMGTLAYVSPEQLQDAKNVDHRADIFSLGVVSYEALSGQVPFTGDGIAQTIVKIVSQEEKPLHILLPFLDVRISAAVSKALRKRARDRYRAIKDFAKELEQALEESDLKGTQISRSQLAAPERPATPSWQGIESTAKRNEALDPCESLAERMRARGIEAVPVVPTKYDPIKPSNPRTPVKQPSEYQTFRPLQLFDTQGKDHVKLVEPAILCYRSGRLIVGDTATRKVHLYSYDGRWMGDLTFRAEAQDTKTRGGCVTKPSGIAIDLRGRIYVSDSSDPYIRIFDSRGMFMKELCNIQGKDGGVQGIALDSTGLLFLSDVPNACVQVFQADLGLWMRRLGAKEGTTNESLQLPAGLATDRLNQIYCADYGTSKIHVFNKSGTFLRAFGGKGSARGLFNVPRALAVDNNDKIYVLDSLNHRVQVFGPTGDFILAFGGRGSEPGKFIGPSDLSIDPANNLLYVADKGNQRIQVFELDQS